MERAAAVKNFKIEKPANLVQTITRISEILDILAEHPKGLSVGELSRNVQLPKGTVHRLLTSLAYVGFVRQDSATKFYLLGFKLMELGNVVLNHIDLRNEARPLLIHLARQVGETVHLVVQDQDDAIYIDKVEPSQKSSGLQMVSKLGTRIPMHCSSVGKVLLSHLTEAEFESIVSRRGLSRMTENTICDTSELREHLKRIRISGFAVDNEENEKGIRCVAAPVRDATGKIVAAVSISAPTARVSVKMLKTELKEEICKTAAAVSKRIGYGGN
jgi:IclR family transcriptional regulator, KDG regulon repressor